MTISLNNLSNQLADVGRRDDALAASEEAAGQHRTRAAARPDAFLPDLAASLNNLSIRLADVGRRDDALAARKEAAAIQRRLDEA
jgi:tetratricopeptide (TPR) repeat protein